MVGSCSRAALAGGIIESRWRAFLRTSSEEDDLLGEGTIKGEWFLVVVVGNGALSLRCCCCWYLGCVGEWGPGAGEPGEDLPFRLA
jgi:hypothetical protein